jgi:hypothetical protein
VSWNDDPHAESLRVRCPPTVEARPSGEGENRMHAAAAPRGIQMFQVRDNGIGAIACNVIRKLG